MKRRLFSLLLAFSLLCTLLPQVALFVSAATYLGRCGDSVTSISSRAFGYDYNSGEKVADFTICGVLGSAANNYATENVFEFVSLAMPSKPTITTQPQDYTGPAGTKAKFTVKATGDNLTYQWYSKTPNGAWTKSNFAGNTTATLTVLISAARNGYQYRCEITNGVSTVTSNAATLHVAASLAITTQPQDYTGPAGTKATFTVKASGENLTYQWYYKAPNGNWTKTAFTGNKTANLTVAVTDARNGYQYRCVITDGVNTVTSNAATLHVVNTVAITAQPQDYTGSAGTKATFTVKATGENLTYQWYYKAPDGEWAKSAFTGNKTATLTVAVTAARNGYQYRCVITDGVSTVTSNAATLNVLSNARGVTRKLA